jgi:phosphopantothenoylcysteine decarboxylase/phosphopantothenate--cysteine ligase
VKILVTAGPTREAIDPARFLSNRSSGKMGYALASCAVERGHDVVLVSGPVRLSPPDGARLVSVVSAEEMLAAVAGNIEWCDSLIMAAAVADWKPAVSSPLKLKKTDMSPVLDLARTPDILDAVSGMKGNRLYVGFAAETDNILENARAKLHAKGLDLVVANEIGSPDSGFETDTNRALLLAADGSCREMPLLDKRDLASEIVAWVEQKAPHGSSTLPP